jgi:hypothetical protein
VQVIEHVAEVQQKFFSRGTSEVVQRCGRAEEQRFGKFDCTGAKGRCKGEEMEDELSS